MFSGFRAYELWCAARAHYVSPSYDILKYHWKFRVKEENFRLIKDRFLFERLAKEYQEEAYFKLALGAFLYDNPKGWARDLVRPNKVAEGLIYRMTDLYTGFEFHYKLFQISSYGLMQQVLMGEHPPEIAAILYDLHKEELSDYAIHPIRKVKLLPKFSAFIGYDKAKVFEIMKKCQKAD